MRNPIGGSETVQIDFEINLNAKTPNSEWLIHLQSNDRVFVVTNVYFSLTYKVYLKCKTRLVYNLP